jgi:hypothetical protein
VDRHGDFPRGVEGAFQGVSNFPPSGREPLFLHTATLKAVGESETRTPKRRASPDVGRQRWWWWWWWLVVTKNQETFHVQHNSQREAKTCNLQRQQQGMR